MRVAFDFFGTAPAYAETLTDALALTYNANPNINAARARTRVSDEALPIAKSAMRPNISAWSSIAGHRRDGQSGDGGLAGNNHVDGSVGVTITQHVFRGFRTKNARLEADANIRASRQMLAIVTQDVLFDAAEAYLSILRDQALLRLQRENVRYLQKRLNAERNRLELGENTKTDIAQTRARLSGAQSAVSIAESNLNVSRSIYRQVVGKEPGELDRAIPYTNLLPDSLNSAVDFGQTRHPAILAAIYDADSSAYLVKQFEGEFLPTISLESNVERNFATNNDSHANSASILGRVSVPLYQGGGASARVRQAKELLAARRIEVDIRRDEVRAAIVSSWGQLKAADATIISAMIQVEAARTAIDGVQKEQKVGERTTLDVLNAEQELVEARKTLILAHHTSYVGSFRLLSSVGLLTAEHLGLPVERYDPNEHYEAVKDKWFGLRTSDGR